MLTAKILNEELKSKFKLNSSCIYNPLDKKILLKNQKKKLIKEYLKKDSIKIINIGRLVDQKDQITLLKSINF